MDETPTGVVSAESRTPVVTSPYPSVEESPQKRCRRTESRVEVGGSPRPGTVRVPTDCDSSRGSYVGSRTYPSPYVLQVSSGSPRYQTPDLPDRN